MTSPAQARISIIGAGPGGLTCARILQRHGIAVTVYDRGSGPQARNQGGTLDLHADDGQLALREAGLLEQFFSLARAEGQEMRVMGPDGVIHSHHVPAADELFKPEIDRGPTPIPSPRTQKKGPHDQHDHPEGDDQSDRNHPPRVPLRTHVFLQCSTLSP